ncbi:MAG: hypothetical protein WBG24_15800 [Syntrophobacteria bacterium]
MNPDVSRIAYCDHGYGRSSGRPRVSHPATYRLGTPRVQLPAVARWHAQLHGLATAIRETSGLWAWSMVKKGLRLLETKAFLIFRGEFDESRCP